MELFDDLGVVMLLVMLICAVLIMSLGFWRWHVDDLADQKCSAIGMTYSEIIQYPVVKCVQIDSDKVRYINITKESG